LEKRSIFTHARRGLTTLHYFGPHPGVKIVLWLILITGVACIPQVGLLGFTVGTVVSCAVYVPMLLASSIKRSKEHDRYEYTKCKNMETALKRDWTV
jgi:hypothetical protein